MEQIKLILVPGGQMPVKGSEEAACYDCFAREIHETDNFVFVKLGFKINMTGNVELLIRPRSNMSKHPFLVHPGTGDPDFRGFEYEARFIKVPVIKKDHMGHTHSIYYEAFPYKVGDRVCQMAIRHYTPYELIESTDEGSTKREGGFGSTGMREVVTKKVPSPKKR